MLPIWDGRMMLWSTGTDPSRSTLTICWRSMAWASAWRTRGSSSGAACVLRITCSKNSEGTDCTSTPSMAAARAISAGSGGGLVICASPWRSAVMAAPEESRKLITRRSRNGPPPDPSASQ